MIAMVFSRNRLWALYSVLTPEGKESKEGYQSDVD
jgi:hypothetical protein